LLCGWHASCLLGKTKKVALEKYLRTEKSAFQAKFAKIGQFFVYNFAKKMKIEISKKICTGEKKICNVVFKF